MSTTAPSPRAGELARPARARSRRRAAPACWRPRAALAAVVLGLVIGQGLAFTLLVAVSHTRPMEGAALVVGDLVLIAFVVAFANRGAERLGAATLGIRRPALGAAVGWGACLLFAAFAVDALFAVLLGGGGEGGRAHTVHFALGTAVLITLGIAVTAPLAEEMAFRGYLFPALTPWRGPWVAATFTALLFGAAHFAALPPAALPAAAFFGFGACLLYWFTGSLLPGVAVHSVNNAIVLAVVSGGQLAPAIVLAPLVAVLLLMPFAKEEAPS